MSELKNYLFIYLIWWGVQSTYSSSLTTCWHSRAIDSDSSGHNVFFFRSLLPHLWKYILWTLATSSVLSSLTCTSLQQHEVSDLNPCLTTLHPKPLVMTATWKLKLKKPCRKIPLLPPLFSPLFYSLTLSAQTVWEDRNGFLSDTGWRCHLPCQLLKGNRKGGGDKWLWPHHDCPSPLLTFSHRHWREKVRGYWNLNTVATSPVAVDMCQSGLFFQVFILHLFVLKWQCHCFSLKEIVRNDELYHTPSICMNVSNCKQETV